VRIPGYIGSVTFCNQPVFQADASNAMPHGMAFTAHVTAAASVRWSLRIEQTK
jgi:hypothetical protein